MTMQTKPPSYVVAPSHGMAMVVVRWTTMYYLFFLFFFSGQDLCHVHHLQRRRAQVTDISLVRFGQGPLFLFEIKRYTLHAQVIFNMNVWHL